MDVKRVLTGAAIGGALGVAGAMLAFTSQSESKNMLMKGKKFINKKINDLSDLM
jgi:gas vesicle protein